MKKLSRRRLIADNRLLTESNKQLETLVQRNRNFDADLRQRDNQISYLEKQIAGYQPKLAKLESELRDTAARAAKSPNLGVHTRIDDLGRVVITVGV